MKTFQHAVAALAFFIMFGAIVLSGLLCLDDPIIQHLLMENHE